MRAKSRFLRKSPKMVKFHHLHENGWNLAKMALFREKGAPRRPNSRPWPERYARTPAICRIGSAQTHTGGLATPSKRSAVRRRTASPFPSLQLRLRLPAIASWTPRCYLETLTFPVFLVYWFDLIPPMDFPFPTSVLQSPLCIPRHVVQLC